MLTGHFGQHRQREWRVGKSLGLLSNGARQMLGIVAQVKTSLDSVIDLVHGCVSGSSHHVLTSRGWKARAPPLLHQKPA